MKNVNIKIFSASLLFTLAVWVFLAGIKIPVTWEYSDLARSLLERHTFSYTHLGAEYFCFCPPLYSFLVAALYFIFNYNSYAVIFAQIIISSLLCVVIFNIGKNVFNARTGVIAGILLMTHPAIIFYVLRYEHTLILDAFMFALSVFSALILYDNPRSIGRAIICGVILGVSYLTRGTALILAPLFMAWIVIAFKSPLKKRLSLGFLILSVSILTVLPWTIRNYIVTKRVILIGAASEESLWRGNNPNASGSSYDINGKTILHDLSNRGFLRKIYATDELGQKDIFEKEAVDFIKNNPGKFAKLFLRKFYYFWWFSPQSGITYLFLFKILYKCYYVLILIGAFIGFYFMPAKRHKIYLLIGVLFGISFFQSIFYVEMRHRWAIEPILFIFTANGIMHMIDKRRKRAC